MSGFDCKSFKKHDDYMTPRSAWEDIQHIIPKDKVLWEAFYGNGQSMRFLQELGYTVEGGPDEDFFQHNKGEIIVTNPPFTIIPAILERLIDLDKPFILIMPSSKINTQYFRKLLSGREIQIIIPRKRIQFEKIVDGKKVESNQCNFDCFYYCYKMNLEKDITWLD
jgi:hypothetical protein